MQSKRRLFRSGALLQGVGKLKSYVSLRTAEGGEAISWLVWRLLWRLRRLGVTQ
jgi:hypothetical protein